MTEETFVPKREADALAILVPLTHAISAGQPLLVSLRRIQSECGDNACGKVMADLADAIESGGVLSDAMSKHPQVFGPSVLYFVKSGESTGVLDHALRLIVECAWKYPGRFLFPVDSPE